MSPVQVRIVSTARDLPLLFPSLEVLLIFSHSAVKSIASAHKFRCADSQPPFHSHHYPAAMLSTAASASPLSPVMRGKHRISYLKFMTFSYKERCTKTGVLPQLFSFTILISWNKSTKTLQVCCFLHEVQTVNICVYFAAKPVLLENVHFSHWHHHWAFHFRQKLQR